MQLKLIDKKPETPDVITFIFEPEQPVTWKAGQFMRYQLDNPNPDDRGESRFFTIASAPFEKHIQITTRFAREKGSSFKKDLQNLQPGDTIDGYGPSGSFTLNYPEEEYVFIAGGIGITPFRSILVQMNHDQTPIKVKLLYANKTEEVVFKEELEALKQNNPDFSINYFIGNNKITPDAIKLLSPNPSLLTFYLSGPEPMIQSFEKMLQDLSVPEDRIRHDYFPGYSEI